MTVDELDEQIDLLFHAVYMRDEYLSLRQLLHYEKVLNMYIDERNKLIKGGQK